MPIAKVIERAWTVTVLGVPQRPIAKRTRIVQAMQSAKTRSVSHPGLDPLQCLSRHSNPLRSRSLPWATAKRSRCAFTLHKAKEAMQFAPLARTSSVPFPARLTWLQGFGK